MTTFEGLLHTNPGLRKQFEGAAETITAGHEIHDQITARREELYDLEHQAKVNADEVKDKGEGLEIVVAHHQQLSPLAKVALLSAMDRVNIEGELHNPAIRKDGEKAVQQVADEFDSVFENLRLLETATTEGGWPLWYLQLIEHNSSHGRSIEISDHTLPSHFSADTDDTSLEPLLNATSLHFRRAAVRFRITNVSAYDYTLDLEYERRKDDPTQGLLTVWHPEQIAVTGPRALDLLERPFRTMQAGFLLVGAEAYGSAREYLLENVENAARHLPALS